MPPAQLFLHVACGPQSTPRSTPTSAIRNDTRESACHSDAHKHLTPTSTGQQQQCTLHASPVLTASALARKPITPTAGNALWMHSTPPCLTHKSLRPSTPCRLSHHPPPRTALRTHAHMCYAYSAYSTICCYLPNNVPDVAELSDARRGRPHGRACPPPRHHGCCSHPIHEQSAPRPPLQNSHVPHLHRP